MPSPSVGVEPWSVFLGLDCLAGNLQAKAPELRKENKHTDQSPDFQNHLIFMLITPSDSYASKGGGVDFNGWQDEKERTKNGSNMEVEPVLCCTVLLRSLHHSLPKSPPSDRLKTTAIGWGAR